VVVGVACPLYPLIGQRAAVLCMEWALLGPREPLRSGSVYQDGAGRGSLRLYPYFSDHH